MAILTEILLLCDGGAECPQDVPYNQDMAKDAKCVSGASLRADACGEGWFHIGRKDYCQVCAVRLGHSTE